jgi:hypothetical protein
VGQSAPRFGLRATGEQVNSSKTLLWPGVDGQVAFLNDHNTRYAKWRKVVEHAIDNRGTCALGSFNHNRFKRSDIIEQIGGATVQIDEQMFAQ